MRNILRSTILRWNVSKWAGQMANSLGVQATNEIMQITAVLLLIQQTDPNTVHRPQPHLNKTLLIG